eukprot:Phypoly_transcript_06662.p1 GENE.Phypoly_transcript_06662~~Phypoly_transcript_06662.p1  ORF type:complete len:519 (+),score=46.92 Phypoly_transcript_06662:155-1711(+)
MSTDARNMSVAELIKPLLNDHDFIEPLIPKLKYVTRQDLLDMPKTDLALAWSSAVAPEAVKAYELISDKFPKQPQVSRDFGLCGSKICFRGRFTNAFSLDCLDGNVSVQQCIEELELRKDLIELVDLSCSFIDEDSFCNLVGALILLPKLKCVDLSFCQLDTDSKKQLELLAHHTPIEYINVVGNPLVCVDWAVGVPSAIFKKFIWIAPEFKDDTLWQQLTCQREESCKDILETMESFYKDERNGCPHWGTPFSDAQKLHEILPQLGEKYAPLLPALALNPLSIGNFKEIPLRQFMKLFEDNHQVLAIAFFNELLLHLPKIYYPCISHRRRVLNSGKLYFPPSACLCLKGRFLESRIVGYVRDNEPDAGYVEASEGKPSTFTTTAFSKRFSKIPNKEKIRMVDMSYNPVYKEVSFKILIDLLLELPNLEFVDFSRCNVEVKVWSHIKRLLAKPSIKYVGFLGTYIPNDFLIGLKDDTSAKIIHSPVYRAIGGGDTMIAQKLRWFYAHNFQCFHIPAIV